MNILYLRELLDINWTPLGYSSGVATTGGTLSFDLYKADNDGSYYVTLHYDAATPDQQRQARVLTLNDPPSTAEVSSTVEICVCLFFSFIFLACYSIMWRVNVPLGSVQRSCTSINKLELY
jgi:hypothetical protein